MAQFSINANNRKWLTCLQLHFVEWHSPVSMRTTGNDLLPSFLKQFTTSFPDCHPLTPAVSLSRNNPLCLVDYNREPSNAKFNSAAKCAFKHSPEQVIIQTAGICKITPGRPAKLEKRQQTATQSRSLSGLLKMQARQCLYQLLGDGLERAKSPRARELQCVLN